MNVLTIFQKKGMGLKENGLMLLLFAYLLWRQAPSIINNFKASAVVLQSQHYEIYSDPEKRSMIEFPAKNQRALIIFWASWCGPCKIEMHRLEDSVKNKKIAAGRIFAINPFESKDEIKAFLKKNALPFVFIDAPYIAQKLNVQSTPTTVFLENKTVDSMSSGMSLVGIWRAEWFLRDETLRDGPTN